MMNDQYYRFQVFVTKSLLEKDGTRATVGAAYLREGHRTYTLRLWMFPTIKFYLMPDRDDKSRMLIFTREPKKDPSVGKSKYFWNAIGNGTVDAAKEVVRLNFDLIEKPIYMSIFPGGATDQNAHELTENLDAS
jgi:hypothetical protein